MLVYTEEAVEERIEQKEPRKVLESRLFLAITVLSTDSHWRLLSFSDVIVKFVEPHWFPLKGNGNCWKWPDIENNFNGILIVTAGVLSGSHWSRIVINEGHW